MLVIKTHALLNLDSTIPTTWAVLELVHCYHKYTKSTIVLSLNIGTHGTRPKQSISREAYAPKIFGRYFHIGCVYALWTVAVSLVWQCPWSDELSARWHRCAVQASSHKLQYWTYNPLCFVKDNTYLFTEGVELQLFSSLDPICSSTLPSEMVCQICDEVLFVYKFFIVLVIGASH